MTHPPPSPDFYLSLAPQYDEFVNWDARLKVELPFIERLLGSVPGAEGSPARLLDAACGTGMHALALARRGFPALGADLSPAMIEHARRNAQSAGLDVRFETAGFGALAPAFGLAPAQPEADPFDALLCLGNSLPHVADEAGLADALRDFAVCLRPGGLLLLQNRNFDLVLALRQRWMEPQAHSQDGTDKLFIRFYDFDPDGRITFNMLTLQRQAEGGWTQQTASTRLLPLTHAALRSALALAGFERLQAYGSLQGEPFDPASSPNLVLAAYM